MIRDEFNLFFHFVSISREIPVIFSVCFVAYEIFENVLKLQVTTISIAKAIFDEIFVIFIER